jgi:hypothetical protein
VVAASGGWTDVSNAVAQAGFGGTVRIPTNSAIAPGTNIWLHNLSSTGVSLLASNPVSIRLSTNDNILNANGIYINSPGTFTTISNLILDVYNTGPGGAVIGIDGSNVCFRITHCTFLAGSTGASGASVGIVAGSAANSSKTQGPWGLVDNCNFYFQGLAAYNYLSLYCNGDTSQFGWSNSMTWGTTNQVVIENCNFSKPGSSGTAAACEAMGGARFTLRYCNLTNVVESFHGIQSGSFCSTLQVEIYMNNWYLPDTTFELSYLVLQRGGTSVIWSNNCYMTGPFNMAATLTYWNECAAAKWQSEYCARQLQYPQDYPSPEQIGQGVTAPNKIGNQPCYVWGNSLPGTSFGFVLGTDSDSQFIQQGRDIWTNSVMPGYTALPYPYYGGTPSPPQPTPQSVIVPTGPIGRQIFLH